MSKTVISHSEVDSFLSCERKHYYAFGIPNLEGTQGLEPKSTSDGLWRGNIGHAALETYYKHLAKISEQRHYVDVDFANASGEAINTVMHEITSLPLDTEQPHKVEVLINLITVLTSYFEYYRDEDKNYTFNAVEVKFRTEVDEFIDFPFTPDLIRTNKTTGKVEVVDHKFLAGLYNAEAIAISPQLAKYVGSLRALGYHIDDAVYDLICHRVLKTKPYEPEKSLKRVPLHLTEKRIAQSVKEQNSVVRSIAELKTLPVEAWEANVRRTASSYSCQHCPFLSLCITDLNGEDNSVAIKYNFNANSYGYDKEEAVV